jgi:hypothetical protein
MNMGACLIRFAEIDRNRLRCFKALKRVVVDKQEPARVAKDVTEFRKQFQKVQYAFDNAVRAYEYISLIGRK